MTKKEFINRTSIVSEESKIIIQKKLNGLYQRMPIRKIVFVNDEIHILI